MPMVLASAGRDIYGDDTRLWSLLRFAEEELKHQELMRRACERRERLRRPLRADPRREAVRRGRAGKVPVGGVAAHQHDRVVHPAALRRARPRTAEELDGLYHDILRFHWIDESRVTPASTHSSSTRSQPT